ncbi:DDE domain-containing protein [Candidatus Aquarickettsia rohweri]|uniref:DDE domain-containing protein n=1 Tax=Candidatus Aquarickettsia rohweri TaxID=2602574 RepID=A0A3R9ZEF3_9RICK|nr:DDE-type integrase/transposase/recombinase [Candidatus Aquarickettsia rohweri]RST62237.1 DDE domain-containing protein [Candidatus Aquarickettsia rohweri]
MNMDNYYNQWGAENINYEYWAKQRYWAIYEVYWEVTKQHWLKQEAINLLIGISMPKDKEYVKHERITGNIHPLLLRKIRDMLTLLKASNVPFRFDTIHKKLYKPVDIIEWAKGRNIEVPIKLDNLSEKDQIEIRQNKYLNNRIEGDHRFIKKRTRPMFSFKSFRSAAKTIAGIELLHMIKKGQLADNNNYNSDFDKFLSLAA